STPGGRGHYHGYGGRRRGAGRPPLQQK
ncbi:unnamed protein product, partial [Rotaria sordida]